MWLVDTSVWIAVFRRKDPLDLTSVVAFDDIVTCLPIVQEVRFSIDCLIAASALRHDVGVLHLDRDYSALARVSQLRQRAVRI